MKKLFVSLCALVLVLTGCGSSAKEPSDANNPVATIEVEGYGTMTFELFTDTPESTNNFISLANSGFYNGLTFHRLVKNFMIQGGDPAGDGTGGPGYSIKGEFNKNGIRNDHTHDFGALAMARSQDNDSAGSQFYIVTGGTAKQLDGNYAVFGQMLTGQDVLKKLNNASVDVNTELLTPPITITSVSVDTKGQTYPEPNKLEDK